MKRPRFSLGRLADRGILVTLSWLAFSTATTAPAETAAERDSGSCESAPAPTQDAETPSGGSIEWQLRAAAAARSRGDFAEAGRGVDAAVAAARAAERADLEAGALMERGNLLEVAGHPGEAVAAYRSAERLARAAGLASLALRANANALRASVEADRSAGLEAELEASVAAAQALEDPGLRAQLLIHLGRSEARLAAGSPDPTSRAGLRLHAARALMAAAEAAEVAGDSRHRSYALGYLGELYEEDGRYEEALSLTQRALFSAQAADSAEAVYLWQWQLGRLQRSLGQLDASLASYRQAVANLNELRGEMALGSRGSEAAFRKQVQPAYLGLVDLLLFQAARRAGEPDEQALLREARSTIEDFRAAELRDYFRDACLDAQRKAAPDEIPGTIVVYPILLEARLELIVSRGGELQRFTSPVERAALEAEALAFRRTLMKRTTWQCIRHAHQLYDWILRPLHEVLREHPSDTLVFVPGGALRTIPFAALRDRETKKFLIELHPVAVTPGLSLTEPRSIDRTRVRLLAAGISEAVQGYEGLPKVAHELSALTAIFPGQQLLNDEFEAAKFASVIAEQSFGIVHIASHGEFTGDIRDSYLLTFDDKISMGELAAMVGKTRFRDEPLELLALSACETAAGDERAALGLAGVALRAGARSALATLWSVNDEASAELVIHFYHGLANPDLSRARALQQAQLALLAQRSFRHPAYWSPFLLISNWL